MARLARLVVPGYPHHVTQRGNRRQRTFFSEKDYQTYVEYLSASAKRARTEIWAYCLMPNHVHLIAVPEVPDALRAAVAEAHRRYARMINFRKGWRGHLWQERFASFVMDEQHLLSAARYIELNPVRAGLVTEPKEWPHSSAAAHLSATDDQLVKTAPLLEMIGNWREFLLSAENVANIDDIRRHSSTGRPLGDDDFLDKLETLTGRELKPKKSGRPRRESK